MFHLRRKGRDILTSLNLVASKMGPLSFGEPMAYVFPGRLLGRSLGRKVYEVDPMLCSKCGGVMKLI